MYAPSVLIHTLGSNVSQDVSRVRSSINLLVANEAFERLVSRGHLLKLHESFVLLVFLSIVSVDVIE